MRLTTRILPFTFVAALSLSGCEPERPNFSDWPLDPTGYEIERLPLDLAASFVRGDDVYIGQSDGVILHGDDRDPSLPWPALGRPYDAAPRLLFASTAGALFVSPYNLPLVRSDDGGKSWRRSLDVPVWRMEEDDEASLYAGNYGGVEERAATLYKSTDGGVTWSIVFEDEDNDHIHTVRWDERARRLYISFGDGKTRGEAYSDDRGETFRRLPATGIGGHTDVAFTPDFILWAADSSDGYIYRTNRHTGDTEELLGGTQYMWWAVAADDQVYIGTMPSGPGDQAALLASSDQGATWQKLIEGSPAEAAYMRGFVGESRNLSTAGHLYCSAEGVAYRVRRSPEPPSPAAVR
ncbi:MAG: hypothetical protein IT372_14530 [Polyangiaceae bacterium]|nr:hypothetical protein [Polyangiaceae bacterium]